MIRNFEKKFHLHSLDCHLCPTSVVGASEPDVEVDYIEDSYWRNAAE